jgi:ATP phosphoribosyltransferase regulatory subunit
MMAGKTAQARPHRRWIAGKLRYMQAPRRQHLRCPAAPRRTRSFVMQAPELNISGTRDYAGDDAVALQAARDAIGGALRRYAYAAINPPILESALPFLNRSGEDIRRRMYIFADPAGQELCLRPELTIPVCRAYLRQLHGKDTGRAASAHEARLSYFGPAFTYEAATEGRYRQFYQAGAEYIGGPDREAADAEIFAAALDCLQAAGLTQPSIEIGDVEIRNAFIDQLPINDKSKTRIRRIALRNPSAAALAATAGTAAATEETNQFGELASLLAAAEPGKAEALIREVFALADVRHVGGRTPEEIVERLTSRTSQQAEPISAELIQGVIALLNIRGAPETAFKAIREHFRKFRIGGIDAVLERCTERMRYVEAYRGGPVAVQFNVGLRRGLEYYTGFLFEIYAADMRQLGHVCGGGRYDNLLEGLGASEPVPAVGFGIGLDRLLLALRKSGARSHDEAPPADALVVAAARTRHDQSIGAAAALRAAGWTVELDSSGRDEESALRYAAKRGIPRIVFVSEADLKKGQVRVRDLAAREDRVVALSSISIAVRTGGAAEPASKRK